MPTVLVGGRTGGNPAMLESSLRRVKMTAVCSLKLGWTKNAGQSRAQVIHETKSVGVWLRLGVSILLA
jgi:hypothetical protein